MQRTRQTFGFAFAAGAGPLAGGLNSRDVSRAGSANQDAQPFPVSSCTHTPTARSRCGTPPGTIGANPATSLPRSVGRHTCSPKRKFGTGSRDTVDGRLTPVCNGLLYDWSRWIQAEDENALRMASALLKLSPAAEFGQSAKRHEITPGLPQRLSVDDSRDIPSIKTDYAGQIPIIHASSGIRRIAALAYMLTWTWSEHRIASELRGDHPSRQLVMLVDEVESHLHPRWQRSI